MAIRDHRRPCFVTDHYRCGLVAGFEGDHCWRYHDNRCVHRRDYRCTPFGRPGCCWLPFRCSRWWRRSPHANCYSGQYRSQWCHGGTAIAGESCIHRRSRWTGAVYRPHIWAGFRTSWWVGGEHRFLAIGDRCKHTITAVQRIGSGSVSVIRIVSFAPSLEPRCSGRIHVIVRSLKSSLSTHALLPTASAVCQWQCVPTFWVS